MPNFDPKDAKPHERWNRARAALIAYKAEAGLDENYISGIPDASVLRGMIVDLQLMLIEKHAEHEKSLARAADAHYCPEHGGSPDAEGLDFIVNIGSYDIYRGGETTGFTFIMIRSDKPGDYITTDHPAVYVRGFFDTQR